MIKSLAFDRFYWRQSLDSTFFDILKTKPKKLFLTLIWESYSLTDFVKKIDTLLCRAGIETFWIVNSATSRQWNTLQSMVIYFDGMAWRSYNEIFIKGNSGLNQVWNSDVDKFLFLIGNPARKNRIRLFYHLYKKDLLGKCNYSLYLTESNLEHIKTFLPLDTDKKFVDNILDFSRELDSINYENDSYGGRYGGIPYDKNLYTNSLFRLISETNFGCLPQPLISEKTWLTIINRIPFVLASGAGYCHYLKQLNFFTFDDIFDIPSYDLIDNDDTRLNCIVEHVEHWLTKKFNQDIILEMINHNYNRFQEYAIEIKDKLESTLDIDIQNIIDTNFPYNTTLV